MTDIVIPRALQIVVDDLGWFCGDDDRASGGASRSGMPRRHGYKDYEAMHELGKALDQKIVCGFCLAEWDPDNRLKKLPQISKYGESWDNASYIDMEEAKKCARVINDSPYIDFALHGMGHGYYGGENAKYDTSDFYIVTANKEKKMVDEEYVRGIIDSFLDIKNYYGIDKEVTAMIPPTGVYRYKELSRILADYGIKYVSAGFWEMINDTGEVLSDIAVENGIITLDRCRPEANNWLVHSVDYDAVPERVYCFGSHWPNWLHADPDRNMEVIKSAIRYFYRCSEQQGTIISRDMRFAVTQTMFWKYAKVSKNEKGQTVIDITDVPRLENMNNVFYVNSRFPLLGADGAKVTEYAGKKNFVTYEIEPEENIIVLK